METKEDLSAPTQEQMRSMIAGLSLQERASLSDPDFITEDGADIIMSDRSMKEPGPCISLDELLEENGQSRRKRRP